MIYYHFRFLFRFSSQPKIDPLRRKLTQNVFGKFHFSKISRLFQVKMEKNANKRAHPYKQGFKKIAEEHCKKPKKSQFSLDKSTKETKSKTGEAVKLATNVDGTKLALFKTGYSLLSNFYPKATFEIDGNVYNSVQQWIDANKAMYFGDDEALDKIMETKSPAYSKKVAREIEDEDEQWWKKVYALTKQGIEEKVKQNEDVRKELEATGDALIAEAQVYNPFWTTGVDIDDKDIADYTKWPGKNMMGKLLMKIRDGL